MTTLKIWPAASGALLIMGTCIGAGMLALPVVTGVAGFLPAIAINLLCCLFMMATGLLFLEAILWMKVGVNVLTLAHHFLGFAGKLVGGVSFLFLYYCLEVSYCSGGAPILSKLIYEASRITVEGPYSYVLFTCLFGYIIYLGTHALNRVNWILMVGLILSFILLIALGSGLVEMKLLKRSNWTLALAAAPTLFGAYGYHNLLPSLSDYLKQNVQALRISIIAGTLIPFLIYSIWQWLIIGTLSLEQIEHADLIGEPITQTLHAYVGNVWVSTLGELFGFFALVTSFLGVSLSMVDFLADGLKVEREGTNRIFLCLAVFVPPVIFAASYPGIFIEAIGIAGGIGEAILNGLLPIGMVWVGRYHMHLSSSNPLFGGRFMLVVLFFITLLIMGIEIRHLMVH